MSDNPFDDIPEFIPFRFTSIKPTGTMRILPLVVGGLEPIFHTYYRVPKKYFNTTFDIIKKN